jgi:hypothetical protein
MKLLAAILFLSGTCTFANEWQNHRLMDAREILGVLDDVFASQSASMGNPFGPQFFGSYVGSKASSFSILNRYAEFGGSCDLNNEATQGLNFSTVNSWTNAGNIPASIAYNSCDGRNEHSKGDFFPAPSVGRGALIHRLCRTLTQAEAQFFSLAMRRIRAPISASVSLSGPQVLDSRIRSQFVMGGGNPGQSTQENWCSLTAPNYDDLLKLYQMFYPGARSVPRSSRTSSTLTADASLQDAAKRIATEDEIEKEGDSSLLDRVGSWIGEVIETLEGDSKILSSLLPEALLPSQKEPPSVSGFYEELLRAIQASNHAVEEMSAENLVELEGKCDGHLGTTPPNQSQVQAINAWRAAFMIMCEDPGWSSRL